MKTPQKIIWTLFLIIGIIFNQSCDDLVQTEYVLKTNFVYKNQTKENISIVLYNQESEKFHTYLIEPNKEITVVITSEGPKTGVNTPFFLTNDYTKVATKVVVKFDASNKCLTYLENEGILDYKSYDNYDKSIRDKSNNTLIYNIDDEELNIATLCE